jgi:hypothetical protein
MVCCGGRRGPRRRASAQRSPDIPANPKVRGGTELAFVGAGRRTIPCAGSGNTYHVAPGARMIRVDRRDVDQLLSRGDFVPA